MVLRVAHVLNSPGFGGVPRVAYALIKRADRACFDPHLFCLKPGGKLPDLGVEARVAATSSKASAMLDLVNWLESRRIHVLHTHSFRPNLYARMAGAVLRPAGLKIVAHYHNDYSDKWSEDMLAVERRLIGVTDASLAVSTAIARHVHEQTGAAPEVVLNGIDLDRVAGGNRAAGRRELGLSESDFAVGLLGRICRQKGVDTFVEAALQIASRHDRAKFFVVGDREDQVLAGRLESMVHSAGLDSRIFFAGHRDNIGDALAGLDLFAAPSRWEGFGLAIAEAMACGVPVVAAAVGGIPEVVGSAARLVPAEDVSALSSEIETVMCNARLRSSMRSAGFNQANKFSWATSARQIESVYKRISENR